MFAVILYTAYEGSNLVGVFSSRELAEAVSIEMSPDQWIEIREIELNTVTL